jgi:hypothetical protein
MATNFNKRETHCSDCNSLKRKHDELLAEKQYFKERAENFEKLLKLEESRNKTIISNKRVCIFFALNFLILFVVKFIP